LSRNIDSERPRETPNNKIVPECVPKIEQDDEEDADYTAFDEKDLQRVHGQTPLGHPKPPRFVQRPAQAKSLATLELEELQAILAEKHRRQPATTSEMLGRREPTPPTRAQMMNIPIKPRSQIPKPPIQVPIEKPKPKPIPKPRMLLSPL
jgi:hypothetical protein